VSQYAGLGEVSGKRVLVRSDLNVPLDGPADDRVITDDGRIRASVPTIRALAEPTRHMGRLPVRQSDNARNRDENALRAEVP